jgi:signal transduction histidine kinase
MDKVSIYQPNSKEKETITETLLKDIAMGGPSLIAIVHAPDLKLVFINTQFEHYLGYTNDDLQAVGGLKFTDLLEKYLVDRLLYQLMNCRENPAERSRYVIYRLKGKNDHIIPFYLYAAPANNDADGNLYHLVLHPELSRWNMPFTSFNSRELFLEHFNCESFGTFEWFIDVDKVFWSIGVYRIYEVDDISEQINYKYASSFIHPDERAKVAEEMKEAVTTGDDITVEFKIITAKKNIKVVNTILRAIRNKEGKPIKFAGSIRDVTDQRQIEQNLKKKVEELNHSNKELEEFAYIASHDMQEPLRKITTFSDRLSEKYKDVLTGDGLMYLSRMNASAGNMRSLINDLLEFSRITKTGQPFEKVNLDLILRQVKTDLELSIEETGTIINSQQLPEVDAVSTQMKQLFTNLITNAIKFHKPDVSPVINIEASLLDEYEKLQHELAKNTDYYKIQISDNGIGFESEYATRIFQVFQRLHGRSEYPGSGIGLAICKKILEYHHGIIFAENIHETGARFTIILPKHQKQKPEKI